MVPTLVVIFILVLDSSERNKDNWLTIVAFSIEGYWCYYLQKTPISKKKTEPDIRPYMLVPTQLYFRNDP